jgi:hypothetical protein
MADPIYEATLYLSLGIIIYYFLIALITPNEGAGIWGRYLAWFFAFLLIVYLAYLVWSQTRKKPQPKPVEEVDPEKDHKYSLENDDFAEDEAEVERLVQSEIAQTNLEKGGAALPEQYRAQRRKFSLTDQPVSDESVITYEYFKRWYLGPEFLEQYTQAVGQGYIIKKQKLLALRKQYRADLTALKPKTKPNDPMARLYQAMDRTGDTETLESTINEIDDLLREIKRRQETLTVDSVRKSLVAALNNSENGLETLTGRKNIKDFVSLQLYAFAQNPRTFFANFQNMILKGPSGVGKTKLAKVISHVFASCGILIRNHVHIITKEALTTPYVNQSAKMTRKLFLANLESVVLLDEAYDLAPQPNLLGRAIDHGSEAITEMVNFVDKHKGLSMIIAAGYEKDMDERFMTANEGMDRRFPHKYVLEPYSSSDLTTILLKFLTTTCPDLDFTPRIYNYIFTMIDHIYCEKPQIFDKQAGDMENLSGSIARSIYGSHRKKWPENSDEIIMSGFNAYLAQKGHSLKLR